MPGETRDMEEEGKNNEAGRGDKIHYDELGKKKETKQKSKNNTDKSWQKKNVDNNFQNVMFERLTCNIFTYVCILGSQWVDWVNGETDSPLINITTLNAFVQFT